MTRFDNAREQLASVQKLITDKLPDRREVEDHLNAFGSRLDDISDRIEAFRDTVAPSVRDLADSVRDAAVSATEEAAKTAPSHKRKIKKAAKRAVEDAQKGFAEFQNPKPPKKRRVGLIVVLTLAGAAVAGAAFAAVRAVTVADEQWLGIDEELDSESKPSDDAEDKPAK